MRKPKPTSSGRLKYKDATPPGARIFEARDRVRWSDVDIAGIIYFGAYVRFVELAETELFRALGFPFANMFEQLDIWLPRVHLDFDFFAPALMDDELVLRTHIARLGASSITMRMIVHNARAGEVDAAATLVVAAVNRATMKSCPMPGALRAALQACTDS
ncbi:MAG: tol-pal system-associated acyl-CoA thioesterase [Vulcanimicrobiaceae bacterium]